MSRHEIQYGTQKIAFHLPSAVDFVQTIVPSILPPAKNQLAEVERACSSPIDFNWACLNEVKTVSIAINDKTRPVPHSILLPPLLDRLEDAGIPKENIHFYIATGTHAPMRPDEFDSVLPQEIVESYPVESHDCDLEENLESLGFTSSGTPVLVNRRYYQADMKVVIGNIEPHHFMGFSGGNKSAAIGLTGRETINRNHAFLLDDRSRLGAYEDNPMRQDVEEIGKKINVHLAINAILNDHKEIVQAIAGDPLQVMKFGYPIAASYCQIPVDGRFDLVIASAGGFPKDINLYQAQKALTNAALMTRDGGTVILVTECIEGIGSQGYVDFMEKVQTFEEALEKFKAIEFKVGPHKAYQFAKIGSRIRIVLVSSIDKSVVEKLLLVPSSNLQQCIDEELMRAPSKARIAILPLASTTLPIFSDTGA